MNKEMFFWFAIGGNTNEMLVISPETAKCLNEITSSEGTRVLMLLRDFFEQFNSEMITDVRLCVITCFTHRLSSVVAPLDSLFCFVIPVGCGEVMDLCLFSERVRVLSLVLSVMWDVRCCAG